MFFLLARRAPTLPSPKLRGGQDRDSGGVLLKHLHTAIAGDAVAEMDDEIALGQIEEAVDGPRFQPAPPHPTLPQAWGRVGWGGAERRVTVKQLLPTQHQHAGRVHQTEAGADPADEETQPVGLREPSRRQYLAQPLAFAIVLTRDQHALARGHRVQFVAHLAHVAAEAFDGFDVQTERRLHRRTRQRGNRYTRKAQ